MTRNRIAIIGAGMAGLACAARLQKAGVQPVVFDKGRGLGGRLATRRTATGLQFDHGAQYVTARSPAFATLLADAEHEGLAGKWSYGDACHVGVPGMSAIANHLAQGLEVHRNVEATAIREVREGCEVTIADVPDTFSRVVATVPAPQARNLLGGQHRFSGELSAVELQPCLTLMAAFEPGCLPPFTARRDRDDPLSWIAFDSDKPGRPGGNCWVAQASPEWSRKHLEEAPAEIAGKMLPLLCDRLGFERTDVVHAVAHRWRYAAVSAPLGRPFMRNNAGTLYLGGDWCIAARVEAAWASGCAIADDILEAG